MILYLIRHAEAIERTKTLPDEWRYLTKRGRSTTKKICSKITKDFPTPNLIITSPLVRATQTAEIFADINPKKTEVIVSELLKPDAKIYQLVAQIKKYNKIKCLMLVGHEPFLSLLIKNLLGKSDMDIKLKKSSCTAIKVAFHKNNEAEFLWHLKPGKKARRSLKKAFSHE